MHSSPAGFVTPIDKINVDTPTRTLVKKLSNNGSSTVHCARRRFCIPVGNKDSKGGLEPRKQLELLLIKHSKEPTWAKWPFKLQYWDLPGGALALDVPDDPGRRSSLAGVEIEELPGYSAPHGPECKSDEEPKPHRFQLGHYKATGEPPKPDATVGHGVRRILKESAGLIASEVIRPVTTHKGGPNDEHICLNFVVLVGSGQKVHLPHGNGSPLIPRIRWVSPDVFAAVKKNKLFIVADEDKDEDTPDPMWHSGWER